MANTPPTNDTSPYSIFLKAAGLRNRGKYRNKAIRDILDDAGITDDIIALATGTPSSERISARIDRASASICDARWLGETVKPYLRSLLKRPPQQFDSEWLTLRDFFTYIRKDHAPDNVAQARAFIASYIASSEYVPGRFFTYRKPKHAPAEVLYLNKAAADLVCEGCNWAKELPECIKHLDKEKARRLQEAPPKGWLTLTDFLKLIRKEISEANTQALITFIESYIAHPEHTPEQHFRYYQSQYQSQPIYHINPASAALVLAGCRWAPALQEGARSRRIPVSEMAMRIFGHNNKNFSQRLKTLAEKLLSEPQKPLNIALSDTDEPAWKLPSAIVERQRNVAQLSYF